MKNDFLKFEYTRRFGVEIEINSFDNRDFKKRPLGELELPQGTKEVANLVHEVTGDYVLIDEHHLTHHNPCWVVKPDSSCGIEVGSTGCKGWHELKKVCQVVESFGIEEKVVADDQCSLHVHIDVVDLSEEQVATVLAYWVKAEAVFMELMPIGRTFNQHCQWIGLMDILEHDVVIRPKDLIKKLGYCKYYSANSFHYHRKRRNTLEFRILESDACLNAFTVKCWVRLLIHFVEMVRIRPYPTEYIAGDCWSAWCWIQPKDVFKMLFFDTPLSQGMTQVRDWFLGRLFINIKNNAYLDWHRLLKQTFRPEILSMVNNNGGFEKNHVQPEKYKESLYGDCFKV